MRVLLSVAAGTDTTAVERLLRAAGVTFVAAHTAQPGGRWIDGVIELLRGCDAVVILPFGGNAETVLVEAGAALGLGLPVVVIARDGEDRAAAPLALRELPVVALGGDLEATAERLSATLISQLSSRTDTPPAAVSSATGTEPGQTPMTERETQRRVTEVFHREGARVISELQTPDGRGRADFAASMPNLLAPAFDPVLVEVLGNPNKGVAAAIEHVRYYLGQLGSMIGMVVVPEDALPSWEISARRSAVVIIGLPQLESLAPGELARLLSHGRNKLVHGVA